MMHDNVMCIFGVHGFPLKKSFETSLKLIDDLLVSLIDLLGTTEATHIQHPVDIISKSILNLVQLQLSYVKQQLLFCEQTD